MTGRISSSISLPPPKTTTFDTSWHGKNKRGIGPGNGMPSVPLVHYATRLYVAESDWRVSQKNKVQRARHCSTPTRV